MTLRKGMYTSIYKRRIQNRTEATLRRKAPLGVKEEFTTQRAPPLSHTYP
jgi:hypothetical protein